jgi:hypothetical protein
VPEPWAATCNQQKEQVRGAEAPLECLEAALMRIIVSEHARMPCLDREARDEGSGSQRHGDSAEKHQPRPRGDKSAERIEQAIAHRRSIEGCRGALNSAC